MLHYVSTLFKISGWCFFGVPDQGLLLSDVTQIEMVEVTLVLELCLNGDLSKLPET